MSIDVDGPALNEAGWKLVELLSEITKDPMGSKPFLKEVIETYLDNIERKDSCGPQEPTSSRSEIILQLAKDGIKAEETEACEKELRKQIRGVESCEENLAVAKAQLDEMLKEIDEGKIPRSAFSYS